MKKFLKFIPLFVIGLIASIAMVGCGSTGKETDKSANIRVAAAMPLAMTYAENGEPCEHDFEAIDVVAATCTEQGYTVYTCTSCGESYNDNFIPALGHTFVDITVPATCTHKGYVTHFCTTCGYEYSDTFVDEKGHTYTEEVVAPTCTEQGYTLHTCSDCGYSFKDSYVEALGHTYLEVVTEPTCTEGGYTTYTCETCGEEKVIPILKR